MVFVHGFTGNASDRITAMSVFRLNGWSSSHLFAYGYDSCGDTITNAQGLAARVDNVIVRGTCSRGVFTADVERPAGHESQSA
ncbi:hypothetical protein AB0G77_26865 [Streptomyces hygroscopicus]|uniref:hypothetical protein n=1 Tax=Streptomyces hygroscopicus TaxID=1912 RepID=UPI0033D98729